MGNKLISLIIWGRGKKWSKRKKKGRRSQNYLIYRGGGKKGSTILTLHKEKKSWVKGRFINPEREEKRARKHS